MKYPSISTMTSSLERSLQNLSLNSTNHGDDEWESSSSSDDSTTDRLPSQNQAVASSESNLELNSGVSLPYHWEQCIDLKTGEMYYINWRNGTKAKEDPRMSQSYYSNVNFYSEEEDEDSSYDNEESSSSSSGSSPSSSRGNNNNNSRGLVPDREEHVLVVGGCKSCLMYFMVPKLVEDCPKCSGHLLHF